MKRYQIYSMLVLPYLIAACSGGGDGNTTSSSSNTVPIAVAGNDVEVTRNFNVSLDASASSDADGDRLSYTWTQISGVDVTGGVGYFNVEAPTFAAPDSVDTLVFQLVVNDGHADSDADTIAVNVLEDVNVAFYVSADQGNDQTGNGSKGNPFASIAKALCEVGAEQQDIYVMSKLDGSAYDETNDPCPGTPSRGKDQILSVASGTSLYGGYDQNWQRHVADNPTAVLTTYYGIRFVSVDNNAWLSGFDVQTQNSPSAGDDVYGVYAVGGSASLYVQDNSITLGDVGEGASAKPGSAYGIVAALLDGAYIERNAVSTGFAGDALDTGIIFSTAAAAGNNGASGTNGGGGGAGNGLSHYAGGWGGAGATQFGNNGSNGGNGAGPGGQGGCGGGNSSGAYGCVGEIQTGDHGRSGENGYTGSAGAPGAGGSGAGSIVVYRDGGSFAYFYLGNGQTGHIGNDGGAGGGGGGGEAAAGVNGGRGGGGGGGGAGGSGGPGGSGGGASIAVLVAAINNAIVDSNEIYSGPGGIGASGGQGQVGGNGGAGGAGANGNQGLITDGGNGGAGGYGGKGGNGGRGGAGGGGPSYGIAVGENSAPTISNNIIVSEQGGAGGFGSDNGNGGNGGNSFAVFDSNVNDGVVPILTNNTLDYNLPGDGGSSNGASVGNVGVAGTRNW